MEMFYTPCAINTILSGKDPAFCTTQTGEKVMNEAVAFDIETTSTRSRKDPNKKIAFMYCWMLDIFDCTIFGRTWQEFIDTLHYISNHFKLNTKRRMIIYIHSLSYEFQFIRKWLNWTKVFATEKRKPLYAICDMGFEFRCSYRLCGYKLSKLGEQMGIEKLPDFDYRLIRTSKTILTEREKLYCIHDVKIIAAYIRKLIKTESGIIYIPLTNTGFVRRLYRHRCINGNKSFRYRDLIRELTITAHEYKIAKNAFAGGFTHASFLQSRKVNDNVTSFDFSSSYPAVLVAEKFPMGKGVLVPHITQEEFSKRLENNCCIFDIEITGLMQKDDYHFESYISRSRCFECINPVTNNGRLWSADRIRTTITNVDYEIIKKMYDMKEIRISNFYYYQKAYLPDPFVETLLELYRDKTSLKDILGKEEEYMNAKKHINASFGMCVTDIVRAIVDYENDKWIEIDASKLSMEQTESQIEKENHKRGRFLYYLWGVFTTAYARKNLFCGIFECKEDYLYSDTDSIKIKNADKHMDFISAYNKFITQKIECALKYHNLPLDYARPKTKEGKEKPLGIWDFDGFYLRFKALRAKSYMYYYYDKKKNKYILHMTQAGVNGDTAAEYLQYISSKVQFAIDTNPSDKTIIDRYYDQYKRLAFTVKYEETQPAVTESKIRELVIYDEHGDEFDRITVNKYNTDPFELFDNFMHIPPVFTGKNTHTYIDDEIFEEVIDCQNNVVMVHEKSYVHLEPQDYQISIGRDYRDFINGYRFRKTC